MVVCIILGANAKQLLESSCISPGLSRPTATNCSSLARVVGPLQDLCGNCDLRRRAAYRSVVRSDVYIYSVYTNSTNPAHTICMVAVGTKPVSPLSPPLSRPFPKRSISETVLTVCKCPRDLPTTIQWIHKYKRDAQ